MKGVKDLLSRILSSLGGSTGEGGGREDRILQFPQSTDEINLDAGASYEKTMPVGRKLRYLCISVPADCLLEIRNDNTTVMWFADEAGTIELPTGVYINELGIKVRNLGQAACRWSCRMVLA